MRLVDTATEQLVQLASPPAQYAILSHTWEHDEVLFHDLAQDGGRAQERRGHAKFRGAVKLARDEGYRYIWIDNCCIDKSSSTELSEAINSMFTWYRKASVCYVYLSSVSSTWPREEGEEEEETSKGAAAAQGTIIDDPAVRQQLSRSRWFLRSWTLQELIAPGCVHFYSREWTRLGAKKDPAWTSILNELTGIPIEVLRSPEAYKNASVAQRMSWAADRQATREEDISYALFGIFDINMAPLYGEGGAGAFRRLQEEIIRRHADDSILAWSPAPHDAKSWSQATNALHRGLSTLAYSPACFRGARDVVHFLSDWAFEVDSMTTTPLGLLLVAPVVHQTHGASTVTAILSSRPSGDFRGVFGLGMRHARTPEGFLLPIPQSPLSRPVYQRMNLRYLAIGQDIPLEALQNPVKERFHLLDDVQLTSGRGRGLSTMQQVPRIWLRSYPDELILYETDPHEAWRPHTQVFEPVVIDGTRRQRRILLFKDTRRPKTRAAEYVVDQEWLVVAIYLQSHQSVRLPRYHVGVNAWALGAQAAEWPCGIIEWARRSLVEHDEAAEIYLDENGAWKTSLHSFATDLNWSKVYIKFRPKYVLGEWVHVLDIRMVDL